jgi:hypothetical protein
MLFDLRARGRRRTVQVVYLGLALLFLLGFVGFGVGVGGGGGGIFNAFTENGGTNSASFAAKVASAQSRTQKHPSNPAAWAALIEAQYHQASEPEYSNSAATSETEVYTPKGKALLAKIATNWGTYLKLQATHPSTELARKMASVFSEQGLNQPASEMRALQVAVTANPPSALLYRLLAESAYKAKQLKVGDAAARKSVGLAPAANRKEVKKYLAEVRKNPISHTPSTITKAPNGSLIATQGGKTFTVKSNGKGGYVGSFPAKATVKGSTGTASTKPASTTPKVSTATPKASTTSPASTSGSASGAKQK